MDTEKWQQQIAEISDDRRRRLLERLLWCAKNTDCEIAHVRADDILIELIDDALVTDLFNAVCKWYA